MNWRKGLGRALTVYFGLCLLGAGLGWAIWDKGNNDWLAFARGARVPYDEATLALLKSAQERIDLGGSMIVYAILFGTVIPLAGAIVGGLGWWIWRGFRSPSGPKTQH